MQHHHWKILRERFHLNDHSLVFIRIIRTTLRTQSHTDFAASHEPNNLVFCIALFALLSSENTLLRLYFPAITSLRPYKAVET